MRRNEIEEARNQAVAQANYFIRHTRTRLTATEMNILYYLFSKVKPSDREFMTVNVEIQDFCKVCGIDEKNGKNYFDVKNAMLALRIKAAWTEYRNEKGRRGQIIFSWVDTATIMDGSGEMQVTLSQSIKPFLIGLTQSGNYTQASLISFLALKSKYSKRLYEILKSYTPRRFQETCQREFGILDLKKLMNAETYNRFANFKQRVLEVAMREINAVTDIEVSYTTRKRLGTTDFVTFHFKLKDYVSQGRARAAAEFALDGEIIEGESSTIDIPENQSPDVAAAPHRQTQEQTSADFETFWEAYPSKVGKKKTLEVFGDVIKNGVPFEKILAGVKAYKSNLEANPRRIMNPANWLNGNHWDDEYGEVKAKPKNKFINFNQREYDWAAIEKMEREYQAKIYDSIELDIDESTGKARR